MKYELELNGEAKSANRIKQVIDNLQSTLIIQDEDSCNSVNGGAAVHYIIKIDVKEVWV